MSALQSLSLSLSAFFQKELKSGVTCAEVCSVRKELVYFTVLKRCHGGIVLDAFLYG